MKVILSPTKKMRRDADFLPVLSLPESIRKTEQILSVLKKMSPRQLQKLWGCNDTIAQQNIQRLKDMDLRHQLSPAILAYEGIAFQYMAPSVFTREALVWVQENLRILSGFYGVLLPMDGVTPYRLEMQAKLSVDGSRDLYDFWGRDLYDQVMDDSHIIMNLASKEYYKCIQKYLTPEDRFITCTFAECVNGKLQQKGTFAKMARGEMVRYLAESQADSPEDAKGFDRLNFHYRQDLSTDTEYIFERIPQ